MQASLIAVVLAGGKSSRMGQDKSTLYSPKLQVSLMEQSVSLLSQLDDCEVLISSNIHAGGIKDIIADCGPLSGIHALVSGEPNHTGDFLFIPVDMPNLSVALLESLLKFGRQHSCAAFPNNSYLPFYMPANPKLPGIVAQQLQGKDWSIRNLLTQLNARSMPTSDQTELVNINNPQDWQQHCV